MSLILDEHREYLADEPRVSAFARAIAEVVKPGSVVVDLGSGTGIMGLLACRAGASRVYAIDDGSILELAHEVARANGFDDRIRFIKGLSTRVELPEKVDVVIADQIGHFGFEAGVIEYFTDARRRLLKPHGAMIPARVDLWIAPVEASQLHEAVEFWAGSQAGFDFHPARTIAANTGFPTHFMPDQILGDPARLGSLDPSRADLGSWSFEAPLTVARQGTLHGLGGWFTAQLSPNVTMTNSPLAAHHINRRNVFLPIDRPVQVQKDDRLRVRVQIRPREVFVRWVVEVTGAPSKDSRPGSVKARFTHSTLHGMLISREDLRRTRPDFIPTLTPWGLARQTVLALCDGERALRDIEQAVFRRHPDLFSSQAEAATFVAEVVTRYAR
ncbi:MAG: 50S ribosomal protein L11 methyltransferase [Nitrospiraceae bacterium]